MDVKNLGCAEVLPILDTVAVISQRQGWYSDEETLKAIYNVFVILSNCVEVTGDPARNIFFISPVVVLVHIVAILLYYPVIDDADVVNLTRRVLLVRFLESSLAFSLQRKA